MGFKKNYLPREFDKVHFIAAIHLVLILYGLCLTVADMINGEYPLSLHEATYVTSYYLVHFLLILLLVIGFQKKMPLLYLPWLIVFLVIFTTVTCFWFESIIHGSIVYVVPSIINITVLGCGWLSWCTVLKKYTYLRQRSKSSYTVISKD